jgi:hypothetical protein
MTAVTPGPVVAPSPRTGRGERHTPWGGLSLPSLRRRQPEVEHAEWCVHHGPSGCEGQIFSLPGTRLLVWMTAPSADDPRLVVEGPDGVVQLPVQP